MAALYPPVQVTLHFSIFRMLSITKTAAQSRICFNSPSTLMSSIFIASHGADDLLPLRCSAFRAPRTSASNSTIKMNLESRGIRKSYEWSLRVSMPPPAKLIMTNDNTPGLKFDIPDKDRMVVGFDRYVVREAERDEELWEAAWLRAESQSEDRVNKRYAQSYKKKFAEQEFNALRKQCKGHHGLAFKCILAVMQELDMKHSAIKNVLGTLDLSIRHFLPGETFPGERVRTPLFRNNNMVEINKYAYVANVCVAEAARRQGIASHMMHLAIALARRNGLTEVYVHVHRKNVAAQGMYQKLGFEMVETAIPQLSTERIYLLYLKM